MIIVGRTGSGKTHHVMYDLIPSLTRSGRRVMYWNGGHEDYHVDGAIWVDGYDNSRDILYALYNRKMVVIYNPAYEQQTANHELEYIRRLLMSGDNSAPISMIVDEAARYAPQGSIDTPLHILATGGRRWGIQLVCICQRIADLSKTIATQASTWRLLDHSQIDSDYLRHRGISLSDDEIARLKVPYTYIDKQA